MIDYRFQGRLNYIPGGALNVQMSAWPVGGNWWEPSGSFTCVAAYQAKGAASKAASLVNLANPGTNDLTETGTVTWATGTGWSAFATNKHFSTGITPANGYTLIVRFADGSGTTQMSVAGEENTSTATDLAISPVRGSADDRLYYHGGVAILGVRTYSGVLCVAGGACYIDGVYEGATGAWSGTATLPVFIGCINYNGTPSIAWNGSIQAIALYSTTLDATQVAEITDNMEAL